MRRLNFKDSDKVGYIAAVDPPDRRDFFGGGKTVVEAAKKGRKVKNQLKALMRYICKRALFAFDNDTIDHREITATADNRAHLASCLRHSAQITLRELQIRSQRYMNLTTDAFTIQNL